MKEYFITREAFQDCHIIMSCHFSVLLIMASRDLSPSLPLCLRLAGWDCVEVLWSAQFMNKRNFLFYSFREAQLSVTNQNEVARVQPEGHGKFPRVKKKSSAIWDDDNPNKPSSFV